MDKKPVGQKHCIGFKVRLFDYAFRYSFILIFETLMSYYTPEIACRAYLLSVECE